MRRARTNIQERIGAVVRRRREALKFSQEAFADHISMHRAYYGAFERGKKNFQISTLERICEGLGARMWEVVREADAER